jgi:hypothetical protein
MIRKVWVLGAGKFGLKAVERIKRIHPDVTFTVIDQKKANLGSIISSHGGVYVSRDGIEFLDKELLETNGPDWIIPAIPVHVASEWIKRRLSSSHDVRVIDLPERVAAMLPNTQRGKKGELYSSLADFFCPDDCNEPYDFCTITKEKRPYRLYDLMSTIQITPYKTVVIKSRQICAGVGGYRPADLISTLKEVRRYDAPVLLCTSCQCHAVVSGFQQVLRSKTPASVRACPNGAQST